MNKLLSVWARKFRKSIDVATFQTKLNDTLCNEPESCTFYFFRNFLSFYERLLPAFPNSLAEIDRRGFKSVQDGFFLPEYGGGGKFPQVYVNSDGQAQRSDDIFGERDPSGSLDRERST